MGGDLWFHYVMELRRLQLDQFRVQACKFFLVNFVGELFRRRGAVLAFGLAALAFTLA